MNDIKHSESEYGRECAISLDLVLTMQLAPRYNIVAYNFKGTIIRILKGISSWQFKLSFKRKKYLLEIVHMLLQ